MCDRPRSTEGSGLPHRTGGGDCNAANISDVRVSYTPELLDRDKAVHDVTS